MKQTEEEFIPINDGMEIPFPPKLRFFQDETFFKTFKKNGYNVRVTQISQTKVRAYVTPSKSDGDGPIRTVSGIGGFISREDFCWEAAKQAAFENAVAKLSTSIE